MSRSTARAGPIEVARYLDVEEGRWSLILRAGILRRLPIRTPTGRLGLAAGPGVHGACSARV
jgi:hypothetical protein